MYELLVVVVLVAALTALATPGFRRVIESSRGQRCSANILLMENAKDAFIIDNPGQTISSSSALLPYLKFGMPHCPSGGNYQKVTDRYARITCTAKSGTTLNGMHDYGQQ